MVNGDITFFYAIFIALGFKVKITLLHNQEQNKKYMFAQKNMLIIEPIKSLYHNYFPESWFQPLNEITK